MNTYWFLSDLNMFWTVLKSQGSKSVLLSLSVLQHSEGEATEILREKEHSSLKVMLSLLCLLLFSFFWVWKLSVGEKARKTPHALHTSPDWQRMKNDQEVMESGEWKFYSRQIFFSIDKVSISWPGLIFRWNFSSILTDRKFCVIWLVSRHMCRGGSNAEVNTTVEEELQDTSPFLYFHFSFDSQAHKRSA